MQPLIHELAELILKDNAILFVGSHLATGEAATPVVEQIADALAQRINYQRPDRSLPAVARDFEVLQGRSALILSLREELARLQKGPDPIHQLVADAVLPTTKLITTRFDQVLESALTQFEKPYVLIVRDTDVPFFDESKVTVIKIQGDINQPDSLVITEDDVDAFINNLPTLSDIVRAFFATKTLIFLGYDLNSLHFKRFFNQVTRNLSVYRRTAYAVVADSAQGMDEVNRRYWQNQNVEIVVDEPLRFLEELGQAVKESSSRSQPEGKTAPVRPAVAMPPHPYKGLQPYREADAVIFAGRSQETMQLTNRVLANRLTILYGESGVGKSSLLQAGLGNRITQQGGVAVVAIPEAGRPLVALLWDGLRAALNRAGIADSGGAALTDSVRAAQRSLDGPVVLVIDQAEQFFLVYDDAERTEALGQLQGFLSDRSLNLRFVISIREDALGRLQPLEAILPNVLNVRYRLERLGQEAAREAIEAPAALFDVKWEAALVQRLLTELADFEAGGVGPAQLQINCERLYRESIKQKPAPPHLISLALFESLGNTASLLGDFLTETIQSLPGDAQPLARSLLGALVSSSGVKQRLSADDLARFVDAPRPSVDPVLGLLVERSLVRHISRAAPAANGAGAQPPQAEYELGHDSLIPRVVSWLGDDFWAAQKAREILRQAAPEWTKRARLLPADDLRLASQRRAYLRPTPTEAEMLFASAVAHDLAVDEWAGALGREAERAILLALLEHPDDRARSHAAARLAAFPDGESSAQLGSTALRDPQPLVRRHAVIALATQMEADAQAAGPGVAAVVAGLGQAETDAHARDALVILRDLAPASDGLLPPQRRSIIRRKVWLARWRRHAASILRATVQGVQGGFVGLGLGIGLFLGLNIFIADGFTLPLLMQRLDSVLFGISAGIPIMGLIGGLAGGVAALAGGVAHHLPDQPRPIRRWLVQIGAGAAAMCLGWLIFAVVMPGDVRLWQTIGAGLLLGAILTAGATQPRPLPPALGLLLSIGAGIGAFVLLGATGLIFNAVFWWLPAMGAMAGSGFYWGLRADTIKK